MKRIEITYKNGFKQIKNVILQTEFKYVIKPRLALAYKLECVGTKPALRTAKSLKESVKKKYGDYCTTESPLYLSRLDGVLRLPNQQGGNHKVTIKHI